MEREFVNYNQALKLKELGFDEPCFGYYDLDGLQINTHHWYPENKNSSFPLPHTTNNPKISAPTFSQAFRWFRDKNVYAKIESYHSLGNHKPFGLSIDYLHESGKWTYIDHGGDFDFQTYEEAQERAIEIIIGILEK